MVKFYEITPEYMRGYIRPLDKWITAIRTGILLAGLIFWLAGTTYAQETTEPKPEGGPVEPLKIAYITRKLNLSTEEAQKFWPIYNDYMKEIRQVRLDGKGTESEIATEEKILNIRKKYNAQFGNALPPAKVNQFFHSEKEFNNFVRKEWMERNQQRQQQQRLQQQRMQQQRRPLRK
ncbi:MAG TPA: hypothetical protein VGZ71_02610 [Puia sp.]|jgi:hypothetical protein|nr:hypothetical protein [Puia sp.]